MRKIQRHTQSEMYAHIEACKYSSRPQKVYCKQQGLAYSTFQYWTKKYREEFSEDEASDLVPGFIPVKVQPDLKPDQASIPNQLHFLFPNGIQVMCPDGVHPEVLKTLLNP
jgi:hypothetical protein